MLLGPQLIYSDDWLAILQVSRLLVLTEELSIVARLHIASVVLIEVIQLIIHIDGRFDVALGLATAVNERHLAEFIVLEVIYAVLLVVILHGDFIDIVRQHVEDNAGGEE